MPSAGSADMGSMIHSRRTWVPGWLSRVRERRPDLAERDLTRMEGRKQPVETDRQTQKTSLTQAASSPELGRRDPWPWLALLVSSVRSFP